MNIEKHLDILGRPAVDLVSGFKGVITSVSFDLYGCIQAAVTPPIDEKGAVQNGQWFDVPRLKITGKKPVMVLPNFDDDVVSAGRKGAANKPANSKV